jgi:hypothetical protein
MAEDTIHQIQRLERERHELYKAAGHRLLTPKQRERIGELANQLYVLWDQHRRDDAARRWGVRPNIAVRTNADESAA